MISKTFNVVGNRFWKSGITSFYPSKPERFTVMPFSYDTAFGGTDANHKNPDKVYTYLTNSVGAGYYRNQKSEFVKDKPLPCTEEANKPIKSPNGKYKAMSFGPIERSWQPRAPLAGTYDKEWLDNVFPFLPADFEDTYFQCAPPDQQMEYPKGGEEVVLLNLTPQGKTVFKLPETKLTVSFFMKRGDEKDVCAVIDAIVIEPDLNRFMVTWRASIPLQKNMFDAELILVFEDPEEL